LGFFVVEVAISWFRYAREDIEEVVQSLDSLGILRVSFEIGFLEPIMSKSVEVVNVTFWLLW